MSDETSARHGWPAPGDSPTITASGMAAEFIASLSHRSIPDNVLSAARKRVLDTVAVALAGSSTPAMKALSRALSTGDGSGTLMWGTRGGAPPAQAALFNAASSHSEDYDDTHTGGVVHGSACVVPAAWAAAEARDLTFGHLLSGVVAGWEVVARVGATSEGAFHARGLHTTSVAGVFGAAAAVCTVLEMGSRHTQNALGLAGSASSGLNAYLEDGSQGKLLNVGFAAQGGYTAAVAAETGLTGPAGVFEGRYGLFEALGHGLDGELGRFTDFGSVWEVEQVSTKPYAFCHFAHATVDAVLDIRAQGLSVEDVLDVECRLPGPTFDLLCRPWESKLNPSTPYSVKFNIAWLVALALIDGTISRTSFGADLLGRGDVRDLARRVRVREWPDSPYPESFPGSVVIKCTNGTARAERLVNRGHPAAPLDEAAIRSKFMECAAGEGTARATHLYELLACAPVNARVRNLADQLRSSDVAPGPLGLDGASTGVSGASKGESNG